MAKKVIIIGSGLAGLASAVRLAVSGFDVEVFEKNSYPGGKIAEFNKNGYRFDTGPSLLTLPGLIQELFQLAGENPEDYIEFEKLEISCRYFFSDNSIISAYTNPDNFVKEIEYKTSEKSEYILEYLEKAKELYNLTADIFIFSPFQKIRTFMAPEAKKVLFKLHKLDAFSTLHNRNRKSLCDKKIIQLFDRYATYNGSNPYQAPATLKIISHLEHNIGAFLPKGGMYTLINALVNLAEKLNIKIHYNAEVNEIIVSDNRVKGIRYGNKLITSDVVLSNMDIFTMYAKILKDKKLPGRMKKQELSSSGIIFYWGIKNNHPELDVHNILFSDNYREEFRNIFNSKTIYPDPTVYIYISSKLNSADAPKNCENWFVMINSPNNTSQDWDVLRDKARKNILHKIKKTLAIDIEKFIEVEEYQDPVRIEFYTNSYRGALYGPSSNSKLSAFYRHANFTRKIKGLYFTGGSVHPGGGIPLCIASAKVVSQLIEEDSRNPKI